MNKQYLKSAVLFLALIFAMPVILIFSKKSDFSETENRVLETFPEFSVDAVADKSYMNGIETFLADHFPARVSWVRAKMNLEATVGRELINGVYLTDERLYEKLSEPDYEEMEKSVNAINKFAETYDTEVYAMIAPTSSGIYEDMLQPYLPQLDQKSVIADICSSFSTNVKQIDVYSALYSSRDEYLYYRTDHHWTSKGAFTAYKAAARRMGIQAYTDYEPETVSEDFLGTYYSKCLYDGVKPDTIDIYRQKNHLTATHVVMNDGLTEETADDIYFTGFLDTSDKYCVFLGYNRAVTTIQTNVETNNTLLIVKDSYANSIVPFFVQNYSKITVIDPRYLKTALTDYINPDDYRQTLFLYNASTFSTDKNVKNIGLT